MSNYNLTNFSNATDNSTDIARALLLASCPAKLDVSWVYVAALPLWISFSALWLVSLWFNEDHVRQLHVMLLLIPLLATLHSCVGVIYYRRCPWEGSADQLLWACWIICDLFKDPLILTCLLALGKGWCITRNTIRPAELGMANVLVFALVIAIGFQLVVPGYPRRGGSNPRTSST